MKRALVSIFVSLGMSASANAARISTGNAAELTAHRIEKLVFLKKVDLTFQTQFRGLEVRSITPGGVGVASFEVIGSQAADQGLEAAKISVILDETGKALSNEQAGTAAKSLPVWKGKDPLTLTELSIHLIEHLMPKDKAVVPFYSDMKAIRISQMEMGTSTMTTVEVVSNVTTKKLSLDIGLDGTLGSYQIK
jgi:hypothetical protein